MDGWIVSIFAIFVISVWVNARRLGKDNSRRWMRLAALFISLYVASVYLCTLLGIVPDIEVRLWMRWIQTTIGAYMIAEALNG